MKFGKSSVNVGDYVSENLVNETQKKIILMIEKNSRISATKLADTLELSVRAVEKNIKTLRTMGILVRHGSARGGYWEVVK